jgi:citrate lyase subunit beta / citryl-CoA lyase
LICNKLATDSPYLPLFVPATRPDRFERAATSGASAIIIDLEDAVAVGEKARARIQSAGGITVLLAAKTDVFVRINAFGTAWYDEDVAMIAGLPLSGVMLPKCESPEVIQSLKQRLPSQALIIALIETPLGMARARSIAAVADRIAFGSIDYAVAINALHTPRALAAARSELVLAAALAGRPAPIDGVTVETTDSRRILLDARHGVCMGMGGKLLIHPQQIAPARQAYRPTDADVARAMKVVQNTDVGATVVDGRMIDAPVITWARRILAMYEATSP